jgi:NAD-dependent deacetylase
VNITSIALNYAHRNGIPVEVVDPSPVQIPYPDVIYHEMAGSEYVAMMEATSRDER